MRWYTTLAAMLDEHSIHYTIEVSELLLHGKNANFDYLFWKKAFKGGVETFEFFCLARIGISLTTSLHGQLNDSKDCRGFPQFSKYSQNLTSL